MAIVPTITAIVDSFGETYTTIAITPFLGSDTLRPKVANLNVSHKPDILEFLERCLNEISHMTRQHSCRSMC